ATDLRQHRIHMKTLYTPHRNISPSCIKPPLQRRHCASRSPIRSSHDPNHHRHPSPTTSSPPRGPNRPNHRPPSRLKKRKVCPLTHDSVATSPCPQCSDLSEHSAKYLPP